MNIIKTCESNGEFIDPHNIIVVLQKFIIHHHFVHIAVKLFRFVLNLREK